VFSIVSRAHCGVDPRGLDLRRPSREDRQYSHHEKHPGRQNHSRRSEPHSPSQGVPVPTYTLLRSQTPKEQPHHPRSRPETTHREPSIDSYGPTVTRSPPRSRSQCVEVKSFGGKKPERQPIGLPKQTPVSSEYTRDPAWPEFKERTEYQEQDEIQVFEKIGGQRR